MTREQAKKAGASFAAAFSLFLGIGFLAGWDHRIESATDGVYSRLALTCGEHDGPCLLEHACDTKPTHRFDIDNNETTRDLGVAYAAVQFQRYGIPSERHLKHRALVAGLLGGPTAAITYKDLAKARTANPTWFTTARIIASIVGGITGYSLGFWAGSNYDVGCDSALADEVLTNKETMRLAERERFIFELQILQSGDKAIVAGSGRNTNPLADDPIVLCNSSLHTRIRSLEQLAGEVDADLKSKDFQTMAAIKELFESLSKTDAYATVVNLRAAHFIHERGQLELAGRLSYTLERWNQACSDLEEAVQPRLRSISETH